MHHGTTIYTQLCRDNVIDVFNELYKRTSYLYSDILVALYPIYLKFFCMNLYSCQMWCFNKKKHLKAIHVAWIKCIRRIWKINSKTHNDLLYYINNCLPIYILLDKRCIKFNYNIINSENSLHSRITLYSLYNGDTTSVENIRYFMHKYTMSYKDWYSHFLNFTKYIDTFVVTNGIRSFHSG